MNINIRTASKWMVHSEKMHGDIYMKGYIESDFIKRLKLLRQQQQQQQ